MEIFQNKPKIYCYIIWHKDCCLDSKITIHDKQMDKKKMKILVVDDDKDLCNLISDIMKEDGYRVSKAYDADSAINKIIKNKIDILIIDNKLSGSSGISVIERSKLLNPAMKAIMISAYGNTSTKLRARDLGVYDFLDKPFDIKVLLRRVSDLVFTPMANGFSMIY